MNPVVRQKAKLTQALSGKNTYDDISIFDQIYPEPSILDGADNYNDIDENYSQNLSEISCRYNMLGEDDVPTEISSSFSSITDWIKENTMLVLIVGAILLFFFLKK